MIHDSSTRSWNQLNAEWWEAVSQDETRVQFIMPYMLGLIKDVSGKRILDLGCGEGGYSRALARKNADVVAIDCSEHSIAYARRRSSSDNLNILYFLRNSNDLYDIEDNSFDIVLCSMMLMDCEDLDGTIEEAARVLKPSGRLFASVLHPCFTGKNIGREGKDIDKMVVVADYFNPREYEHPLPYSTIPVIWRHRTIEEYVKLFVKHGLTIADLNEARPSPEQSKISVTIDWLNKIPLFLYWELLK